MVSGKEERGSLLAPLICHGSPLPSRSFSLSTLPSSVDARQQPIRCEDSDQLPTRAVGSPPNCNESAFPQIRVILSKRML